jgi:hypothetical protein
MFIRSVNDISPEVMANTAYDLAIFSSGYEDRCTYVPARLTSIPRERVVVLGFAEYEDEARRARHDAFFTERYVAPSRGLRSRDDAAIYQVLERRVTARDTARILVDYSSMSRVWYASVVNWFRASTTFKSVELDFCYAGGNYVDGVPEKNIADVVCVPGCEGTMLGDRHSVAIFGLGFDEFSPFTIIERTEPKEVFAFYADPGSDPSYPSETLRYNAAFLAEYVSDERRRLPLPISSVESTYVKLAELLAPFRTMADITVTPCGPKPHVLASILLAMRFRDVSCLYVSGMPARPINVVANGAMVCSRVQLAERS